jgi:hypothetical protein
MMLIAIVVESELVYSPPPAAAQKDLLDGVLPQAGTRG